MSLPHGPWVRSLAQGSKFTTRLASTVGPATLGFSVMFMGLAGCGSSPGGAGPRDAAGGSTDTVAVSEAPSATANDGAVVRSHCPSGGSKGADLVRVGWTDGVAFCIDSTEVTNAEYRAFLDAAVDLASQPDQCRGWNLSFQPAAPTVKGTNGPACPAFDPVSRANLPVVCVDWCDADAYCRWAGKRLCGRPGGGGVLDPTDAHGDEWVIACTGDQARRYPYDNGPVVARCVDRRYPQAGPDVRPVKEATACEGGVAGVFDMSGNAWEWTNDCTSTGTAPGTTTGTTAGTTAGTTPGTAGSDACLPRGGSFSSDVTAASCFDTAPFHRDDVAGDTGFRCCVDAEYGAAAP